MPGQLSPLGQVRASPLSLPLSHFSWKRSPWEPCLFTESPPSTLSLALPWGRESWWSPEVSQ